MVHFGPFWLNRSILVHVGPPTVHLATPEFNFLRRISGKCSEKISETSFQMSLLFFLGGGGDSFSRRAVIKFKGGKPLICQIVCVEKQTMLRIPSLINLVKLFFSYNPPPNSSPTTTDPPPRSQFRVIIRSISSRF